MQTAAPIARLFASPYFTARGLTGTIFFTLPTTFSAGDALGSFNSTMRLLAGIIFGVGTVWFAFPYVAAAFHEVREELAEKIGRRGTNSAC